MGFFDGSGPGGAVDVVALLDGAAGAQVAEAVQVGALVSLSTTRDGGALGVTVTVDGAYERQYFRDAESLELWLSTGMPDIKAAVEDARPATASDAPRRRARRR